MTASLLVPIVVPAVLVGGLIIALIVGYNWLGRKCRDYGAGLDTEIAVKRFQLLHARQEFAAAAADLDEFLP